MRKLIGRLVRYNVGLIKMGKKNKEMKIIRIININNKAHTRTTQNIKLSIIHLFRTIGVQDS